MALQFSITAIGVMVVQAVLNDLETMTVATYTAASKIDSFAQQPYMAMGAAIATYAAQNFGAHRFERIRKGVNSGFVLMVVCCLSAFLFVLTLRAPLLKLFSEDYEVIQSEAYLYLMINSSMYLFASLIYSGM